MEYPKKSLGQNFLIDKNITKKIVSLTDVSNQNIIEIGAGNGALTDELIKKKPKSLILIEKDDKLVQILKSKYQKLKFIKIFNHDILDFNLENIVKKNSILFGNLPYNISSQIIIKILKFKKYPPKYKNLIFMFQKELGDRIIGKFPSKHYGRLSVISNYKLNVLNKFLVSPNCFFPRPKVNSIVIHFQPKKSNSYLIKNLSNLEKITQVFFSNKRKMINKNLKKLFNKHQIIKLSNINFKLRPAEIKPEIYYRITKIYEEN